MSGGPGYPPVGGYPPAGGYAGGYPPGGYPVGGCPPPGSCPPAGGYAPPPVGWPAGGYAPPAGYNQPYPAAPAGYAAPQGYFFIKSRLNGLVLDIQGASRSPGARVVTWQKKANDNANQLWTEDAMSGTIRTKLDPNLCMEIRGDCLVVNPCSPGNPNQQWMRAGDRIQARHDPNRVLDVAGQNRSAGAKICAWQPNNQANQSWDFEYEQGAQPPSYGNQGRPFFIRSELHGKVLDVKGGSNEVIVWPKKSPPEDNQLWYFDQYGVILSKVRNSALEERHDKMTVQPYRPGDPKQQWVYDNRKIFTRNKPRKVLDIARLDTSDGAKVIEYAYNGGSNQHWAVDYI